MRKHGLFGDDRWIDLYSLKINPLRYVVRDLLRFLFSNGVFDCSIKILNSGIGFLRDLVQIFNPTPWIQFSGVKKTEDYWLQIIDNLSVKNLNLYEPQHMFAAYFFKNRLVQNLDELHINYANAWPKFKRLHLDNEAFLAFQGRVLDLQNCFTDVNLEVLVEFVKEWLRGERELDFIRLTITDENRAFNYSIFGTGLFQRHECPTKHLRIQCEKSEDWGDEPGFIDVILFTKEIPS